MRNKKFKVSESEKVEVVVTKEMTYGEYMKNVNKFRKNGWKSKVYKIGFYSRDNFLEINN